MIFKKMRQMMKIAAWLFVAVLTAAVVSSCRDLDVPEPPPPFDVAAQYKIDSQLILNYIDEYGLEGMQFTESGIAYKMLEDGEGPVPNKYDIVSVHYILSLLDSSVVETSMKEVAMKYDLYDTAKTYSPLKFNFGSTLLGDRRLIEGFVEAVDLMKLNDRFLFIIPSKEAYGPNKVSDRIPASSVLVYDIKMVEIR